MRFLNFNIRYGGEERTPKIISYLLNNDYDLIVLTEFIMNEKGKEIIRILTNNGYETQQSNNDGSLGSFIASEKHFETKHLEDRWTKVYIPQIDLYVLAVYVPDQPGTEKDNFWNKILKYAKINIEENVLIAGDFNSCNADDSSNATEYYAKELMKLEELGYIDLWKCYSIDGSDRYTWFHDYGTGFRLDYAFVSPKLATNLEDIIVYHDSNVLNSKLSDHSPLCFNWEKMNITEI